MADTRMFGNVTSYKVIVGLTIQLAAQKKISSTPAFLEFRCRDTTKTPLQSTHHPTMISPEASKSCRNLPYLTF